MVMKWLKYSAMWAMMVVDNNEVLKCLKHRIIIEWWLYNFMKGNATIIYKNGIEMVEIMLNNKVVLKWQKKSDFTVISLK